MQYCCSMPALLSELQMQGEEISKHSWLFPLIKGSVNSWKYVVELWQVEVFTFVAIDIAIHLNQFCQR